MWPILDRYLKQTYIAARFAISMCVKVWEQATRFTACKTSAAPRLFSRKKLFVDERVLPLHRASGNNVTRSELWRVPNKCERIYVILPVVIPSLMFRLSSSSSSHLYISLRLSLFLFRSWSRVRVTLITPLFVASFSDRSRRVASRERRMNRSRQSGLTIAPWYF